MPFNVGVGGAMRAAFCYAKRNSYDVVVQVDADGQHDPSYIPVLLAPLKAGASVVVGARFDQEFDASRTRRLARRLLASEIRRVTGSEITDATSGFRAADTRAISLFADRYPAEYLGDTAESLVVASREGLPIAEVPVKMRSRQGGQASHRAGRSALYLGRVMI